jgi:ABC-type lipoprotein export system ATPase subunit
MLLDIQTASGWLHIYGQSGIGKSTLLQQFIAELEVGESYFLDKSPGQLPYRNKMELIGFLK